MFTPALDMLPDECVTAILTDHQIKDVRRVFDWL
jgi:hypothetical protein